ncbi:BREX-1 system phosphatase PglZ type A [Methylobacterium oxalidis]|uniref:BREX-1 system phosphatase PglZ type A n=1 Tax=Methylobacterium oxalidis TaxID=944322 RepID=UPI0033160A67
MSNVDRIHDTLARFLDESGIVFWSDPDRQFGDFVAGLRFENTCIVRTSDASALETKLRIASASADERFVLYEDRVRPEPAKDWLLDIRHYARSFSADRASHIREDLGLADFSMRDHIAARSKFFASKDRLARMSKLVSPSDRESDIDRKIMATLLRIEHAEFFSILIALYDAFPDYGDLDAVPDVWEEFEKYDVVAAFWQQARNIFAFEDENPSLRALLIRLLVTDFAKNLNGKTPTALTHLRLPGQGAGSAVVFVAQWQDSALRHRSFDRLSQSVARAINLDAHLHGVEPEYLQDTKTFLVVEKALAVSLRDRIIQTSDTVDADEVTALVRLRKNGFWANESLGDTAPRKALASVYDALGHAAALFGLRINHAGGFERPSPEAFWKAYETEFHRFDMFYRHFCEAADEAERAGWDILKALREKIENVYGNSYVSPLASAWAPHAEAMLSGRWDIPGVVRQARFYEAHVRPILEKDVDSRVFVIISDALRYEAAKELTSVLNGAYRLEARITSQLGVLPSYTQLGMASLLPHQKLGFENGIVTVDGRSSSGLDNRSKILASQGGVAIKASELMEMSKEEGRAFLRDKSVVYVYHNHIDQTADAGDEDKTFTAVRTTIDYLASVVKRIVNSLNGTKIFVTADHGFLFREAAPTAADKNAIESKPAGTVLSKKRYLIGTDLGTHPGAYAAPMSRTSNIKDGTEFWVPKGTARFHFMGGTRFLHGGAMPQEICVPLIQINYKKKGDAEATRKRVVQISLLGTNNRITSARHRFRLCQTEQVTDRIRPLKATVGIYSDAVLVSDVKTLSFASTAPTLGEEWQHEIWLTLSGRMFDKKTRYRLILRNTADETEVLSQDVVIDLAIASDFD